MNKKEQRIANTFYFYTKGDKKLLPSVKNSYRITKKSNKFHNDYMELITTKVDNQGWAVLERIGINKNTEEFDKDL